MSAEFLEMLQMNFVPCVREKKREINISTSRVIKWRWKKKKEMGLRGDIQQGC